MQTRRSLRILGMVMVTVAPLALNPKVFPLRLFCSWVSWSVLGFSCGTACDPQSTLCCFIVNTDEHTISMPLCVLNLQHHIFE